MFPIEPLERFTENNPSYKLVRPFFFNVLQSDYLVTVILLAALLSGVMQITQDNFVCLPVIECSFSGAYQDTNTTAQDRNRLSTLSSLCEELNLTITTNKDPAILLTKLQDRRQYDFIDSVCRQKKWQFFAYYFPFVIFIEAVVLIIIGNFWLKFPKTSSILDNFCNLVEECFNLFEKNPSLIDVIKTLETTSENEAAEPGLNEERINLNATMGTQTAIMEAMTLEEARKAKILRLKVKKFQNNLKRSERCQVLSWTSKIQVSAQVLCALVDIIVNRNAYVNLNDSPKCEIDEVIDETYSYFKCSHTIIPYFQRTLQFCFVILGVYLINCLCSLCWQMYKTKRGSPCILDRDHGGPATGDFALLLYLLDACSELHLQRFSLFLSESFDDGLNVIIMKKADFVTMKETVC